MMKMANDLNDDLINDQIKMVKMVIDFNGD